MRLLFLRGMVPTDRDPKQIMFNNLDECDDMWTLLAHELCKQNYGEIWYWGGKRKTQYKNNFVERWMPKLKRTDFQPDVVFARGGFKEYDQILKQYPNSFKIYYGAGKRFYPQYQFKEFDLILNDTIGQLKQTQRLFPNIRCSLFIKPAADNIFKPKKVSKEYDVIHVGNEHPHKGHKFLFKNLPNNIRILQVGKLSGAIKKEFPHIKFIQWVPRKKIPNLYAKSKIAICWCENVDSCPRVIPEAIACGCPILISKKVNIWVDKYINSMTGKLCDAGSFRETVIDMLENYRSFHPYQYYQSNLSIQKASLFLKGLIC